MAAPTQGPGSITAEDGRVPAGRVTSPESAPPPAVTAPVAVPVDESRQQELARLSALLGQQRSANRRWLVPFLGLALSVASVGAGWTLFAESMSEDGATCDEDCGADHDRMGPAGMALMAIGSALFLVSTPMLAVRCVREARMKRTEAAIRQLGGQVSFAPRVRLGEAGFSVRARF